MNDAILIHAERFRRVSGGISALLVGDAIKLISKRDDPRKYDQAVRDLALMLFVLGAVKLSDEGVK